MSDYTPNNNPYIPGDPYSYDLKWMVNDIQHMEKRFAELDDQIEYATDKALASEGFANGEQNGEAVNPDSPYYHNNSKYWKDEATNEADRARNEADRSDDEALVSEGYARGTQDGQAVTSGSPYYQNNSKYYSEESANSAQEAADYAAHIADPVSGLVTDWLAANITNPSSPPVDTSLMVGNAAGDSEVVGHALEAMGTPVGKLTLLKVYDTVSGKALKQDGTTLNAATHYKRYKIPENITDILLKGSLAYTTSLSVLWFAHDGVMISQIPVTNNPMTFSYEKIAVDNTATDIYISEDIEAYIADSDVLERMSNAVKGVVVGVEYASASGLLRSDGTINTTYPDLVIHKYKNAGYDRVILNGSGSLGLSSPRWSYIWFLDSASTLLDSVNAYQNPIVFNENRFFTIPAGCEEIWVQDYEGSPSWFTAPISFRIAGGYFPINEIIDLIPGSQWRNKVWYGYGTSLTNTNNEGKYPNYLAPMAGLKFVNKGISGGGIGDLGSYSRGQVYNAICNITDGKLDADLITLETGANDTGPGVPIGDIYDTGQTTLCGCLNDCIRYLQANTDAQIVIMPSCDWKASSDAEYQMYEDWMLKIEEICKINRVHYIRMDNNIGYGKLNSAKKSLYCVDNIHQTNLGGYVTAQNIWYQLRNIPCFYASMP